MQQPIEPLGNLAISRKLGATVVINDNITVTVTEINERTVKLLFTAPKSVPIHRGEVQRRINEERTHGG